MPNTTEDVLRGERPASVNLYRFIRLRTGGALPDRELARRWGIPWRSYLLLKAGRRQVPRVAQLEALAQVLGVDPAFVFEVARGVPAERVHGLLLEGDHDRLAGLLMRAVADGRRREEECHERLRLLLERVTDVVFTLDVDGVLHDVNRAFCELVGRPKSALSGTPLAALLAPDAAPALDARFAAVYREGRARGVVLPLAPRPAEEVVLEVSAVRVDGADGYARGLQATGRDVTERSRMIQALRRSEARWRNLVACAPDAVTELDLEARIVRTNYTLLGEPGEVVAGDSLFDHVDPEHHDEVRRALDRVRATRRAAECLAVHVTSGVRRRLHARVGPLLMDGEVAGFIHIGREVAGEGAGPRSPDAG